MPDPVPLLAAAGVTKRFGPTVALDGVDFALRPGTVHALLGENGAGKSTLARVLAGVVRPDGGRLVHVPAPGGGDVRGSRTPGVAFVPQSLSLVGALSLVENALVGEHGVRAAVARRRAELARVSEATGIAVDLDRPTAELPLAERQLGEVLLGLAGGARVLLLDEPTASLGPVEIDRLLEQVRTLAATGAGVVLITHRLDEVMRVADDVTVLRAGRRVHAGPAADVDAERLAYLMIGERETVRRPARRTGRERLVVRGLTVAGEDGGAALHDVGLTVRGGEIVAVAGVAGSGQRTLADAIAGVVRPRSGRVELDGVDVTGDAPAAVRARLAYVPEERAEGLVGERSVADNAILLRAREPAYRRAGMRLREATRAFAASLCARFDVRPPRPELPAGALSGGNQQKLMVGRELERSPAVVLAHGPTQGLDLGAAAAVQARLEEAAAGGAAVVLVSADLDEVLALADRIVVLAGGRVADELDGRDVDLDRLGRAMAGLTLPEGARS